MPTETVRLNYAPRAWQKRCHLERKRFTVLALHRRAGKTELAIMELLDKAIKCKADLGFYVYAAPFLKQAKAIAWARLKSKIDPFIRTAAVDVNEADLAVELGCARVTVNRALRGLADSRG